MPLLQQKINKLSISYEYYLSLNPIWPTPEHDRMSLKLHLVQHPRNVHSNISTCTMKEDKHYLKIMLSQYSVVQDIYRVSDRAHPARGLCPSVWPLQEQSPEKEGLILRQTRISTNSQSPSTNTITHRSHWLARAQDTCLHLTHNCLS